MRAYNLLCAVAMCECESVSPSLRASGRANRRVGVDRGCGRSVRGWTTTLPLHLVATPHSRRARRPSRPRCTLLDSLPLWSNEAGL